MSAPQPPPRRVPALAPPAVVAERRDDGAFVLRSPQPLRAHAPTLGRWLERWARERPDAVFLAERPSSRAPWRTLGYAEALAGARAIAQALLERGLSLERPVMILSGNSIAHALLTLGGYLSGVPVVPVSEAYSLRSADHAQLRGVAELVTPGLVFAANGQAFAPALRALDARAGHDGIEIVTADDTDAEGAENGAGGGTGATPLSALLATAPGAALAAASVGPDSVAKILMTSGSTGRPKGVLNSHRMLTSNQEALAQVWPFIDQQPPVIVDWLPWSHTFGGNHNLHLILRSGGTMYIDGGRPLPGRFDTTLENLADIAPTLQFNVPAGYALLVQALERERGLREHFFSRLQGIFYAAAALPQQTWDRLDRLAEETLGHRLWLTTAWGGTETSPLVTSAHFPSEDAGNIGLPVPGCALKFVPAGGKRELRVAGPNVTPGYHRQSELTAAAFDDEGFYRIGDAGELVDAEEPARGVRFAGRVAEDFKLASGTWVDVGGLRTASLSAAGGLLAQAVVGGHDSDAAVLLAWLDPGRASELAGPGEPADWVRHPAIHQALRERLRAPRGTGASQRIARVLLLVEPPQLDAGEITDKGYVNAAAVLAHRAAEVARCVTVHADDDTSDMDDVVEIPI
ncbi:feruloyl-CoA synthase [Haliangium ochraceum]|uniref:AMP-dependent synthetase and ligase n=1 Tax=Haliangium ochraceum (strain DSM 14365 / JCM 11303 / SMP-2) TaxID=502025 RepID=D0LGU8_HALO1|nr:feruloyl-CoA synthase [Haliangium ochraceum]ACY14670.1 AMP-dependent synthetase and ligase [Haliangium ochraceum DSM 14365]